MRRTASVLSLAATMWLAGCSREQAAQPLPPAQNFQPPAASAAAPADLAPSAAPGTRIAAAEPAGSVVTPVATRRVVRSRTVDDSPRVVVRKRSKKKSAAIIGGSAAAGAAIGALAGGGKGAAIGAIAGGGGGLIYDQATRKKREVVR